MICISFLFLLVGVALHGDLLLPCCRQMSAGAITHPNKRYTNAVKRVKLKLLARQRTRERWDVAARLHSDVWR
mgnify:CR=1 FL=1